MSLPLRVMFLSSCVRGGGAGWSLYYLLKHLDRAAIEPLVVVPDRGIFDKRFTDLGLRVLTSPLFPERAAQQRFASSNKATDIASHIFNVMDMTRFGIELVEIIRREGIHLVYCNNMLVKPLGGLAAQVAKVPCVFHVRNLHEKPAAIFFYCQFLARLSQVRLIISNSAASAVPYNRSVPAKVRVVHNGIDFEEYAPDTVARGEFRHSLGIGQDQVLIGFTGNLIKRKGLKELVHAAGRMVANNCPVVFVIVGKVPIGEPEAYLDECTQLATHYGLGDRFRFVGFTPDVRPIVADCDILVLPSLQEPFGRSIIEAMALGTPVVASHVGGIPEIIRHEQDGLLVAPGNVHELTAALKRLVEDPPLRRTYSESALQRVHSQFNVALLTRQIQALLRETVL